MKFPTKEAYEQEETKLFEALNDSDGSDQVIIFIEEGKAIKKLPPNRNVDAGQVLIDKLSVLFGEQNVKVTV